MMYSIALINTVEQSCTVNRINAESSTTISPKLNQRTKIKKFPKNWAKEKGDIFFSFSLLQK